MKIKIIKASKEKWYANRIGKIYHARINEHLPNCYILRNYRTILRTVAKSDAVKI
jgi:hypothetical protein